MVFASTLAFFLLCLVVTTSAMPRLIDRLNHYELVHIETQHFNHIGNVHGVKHHPHVSQFSMRAFNTHLDVSLEKNTHLLADSYHERRVRYSQGKFMGVHSRKEVTEIQHCFYQGQSNLHAGSRIAVSSCNGGFRGMMIIDGVGYGIEPSHRHLTSQELQDHMDSDPNASPHSSHVVWRMSDRKTDGVPINCGVTFDEENGDHDSHAHVHPHDLTFQFPSANLNGRKVLQASQLYVEFMVVNDYRRYVEYDISGEDVEEDSLGVVNIIDSLYIDSSFSTPVSLTMVAQLTFIDEDPWEDLIHQGDLNQCPDCASQEVGVDALLAEFHAWRTAPADSEEGALPAHDNAQLFSYHDFQSGVIGYAGVRQMCLEATSGGIDQTQEEQVYDAAVIAHEMGHNLGFYHDSNGNDCAASGYIMNAIIGEPATEFSTCSHDYFESSWLTAERDCLDNEPTTQWTNDPICGNGFKEEGEECDCGSSVDCSDSVDPCCDGPTCMLLEDSECSERDACCDSCEIQSAGTVCRYASNDCDITEECDGFSSECSENFVMGAGHLCSDAWGEGACLNGQCMSLAKSCDDIGLSFTGGPFYQCPTTLPEDLCGTLECFTYEIEPSGGCGSFPSDNGVDEFIQVTKGVHCGEYQQCLDGACVDAWDLSEDLRWKTNWPSCFECGETQVASIRCEAQNPTSGALYTVIDGRCPAPSPDSLRLCPWVLDEDNITWVNCVYDRNEIQDFANYISEMYGALDKAEYLRRLIPRVCGPEYMVLDDYEEYVMCTFMTCIIGCGLALIALGVDSYWCCWAEHCEKHCLTPPLKEYSKRSTYIAFFVILGLSVFTVGWACVGAFYNGEVRRSLTDEQTGITTTIENSLSSALVLSEQMMTPLLVIYESDVSRGSILAAENAVLCAAGTGSFVNALENMNATIHNIAPAQTITGEGGAADITVECTVCDDLIVSVQEQRDRVDFYQVNWEESVEYFLMLEVAMTSLMYGRNTSVFMAINATNASYIEMSSAEEYVDEFVNLIHEFDYYRYPFTFSIFGIVLILASMIGAAGVKQESAWFKRHFQISLISLPVMYIMFGIHLPFAVLFGDSCDLMTEAEADASVVGWDQNEAAVFQACLLNASLVSAFNLTQEFQLKDIYMPNLNDNDLVNYPTFNDLLDTINALTPVEFGVDQPLIEANFDDLDVIYGQTDFYNRDNVADIDPSTSPDEPTVTDLQDTTLTLMAAEAEALILIAALQENATLLQDEFNDMETAATEIVSNSEELDVIYDLNVDAIAAFNDIAYCGEVGQYYYAFKASYCNTLSTGVFFIALSLILVGVCFSVCILLSVRLVKACMSPEERKALQAFHGIAQATRRSLRQAGNMVRSMTMNGGNWGNARAGQGRPKPKPHFKGGRSGRVAPGRRGKPQRRGRR